MFAKTLRIVSFALSIAFAGAASAASAHTAWLVKEAAPGTWLLQFGGHQGKLEPAIATKLRQLSAIDERGRPLPVKRATLGTTTRVTVGGQPSLIALHYDNGIHSRTATPGASVERPMNQVRGAVSAVNAQKYHKTIVRWSPVVTRPIGQPFEVTPVASAQPIAGEAMRVQVRLDGKPIAGVNIGFGEDNAEAVTDAAGIASFRPRPGANRLWAGKRIETAGNPRFTQLSYEYLLSFDARPSK